MAGLSSSGLDKKTLQEALSSLNNRTLEAFGAVNTSPESIFGQYNGIISEIISELWDLAEQVYGSQYANSALGVSLDAVAELNNISRLAATSSSVLVILEGTPATLVASGTQFRQSNTDEIFSSSANVTIQNTNMLRCVMSVNDASAVPHTIYIVSVSHGTDNFSSSVSSSALDVLNDLASQITTLGNHSAVVDATLLTLTISNPTVEEEETFEISTFSSSLDQDEIWSPVTVEAVNTGSLEVPAGSIETIETPISGLDQVENLAAGTQGRDLETDDEFRLRRKQSLRVVGAGTVPAIEARIVEEVEEATSCTVKDNRTDLIDVQGRPPHSFETIVTFSPDTSEVRQSIADKLWEIKPAGIQTFGNISQNVIDSAGDTQTVLFSAPILKYLHIDCDITLNPEETFPNNGEDLIKESLAAFGNDLRAGEDVIRQRFFNSVYAIGGVLDIVRFDLATTVNPADVPSVLLSDLITAETEPGLYDVSGPLNTNGVVSGMVVKDTSGSPLTSVRAVNSQTQFRVNTDVFSVSDQIDFGGYGAVNIGINANERAVFDVARIAVSVS